MRNAQDVAPPEPWVAHPAPSQGPADQNEHETEHDERHEGEVQQDHDVREDSIDHRMSLTTAGR